MALVSIENRELVLAKFGKWPAFHDAEIVSILFERAEQGYWPVISLTIDTIGGFDKATATPARHYSVELQLAGVHDYELASFNHQNVVFSIDFAQEDDLISCVIEPCYGVSGYIKAERIIVKSVTTLPDRGLQRPEHGQSRPTPHRSGLPTKYLPQQPAA